MGETLELLLVTTNGEEEIYSLPLVEVFTTAGSDTEGAKAYRKRETLAKFLEGVESNKVVELLYYDEPIHLNTAHIIRFRAL